MDSGNRDDKKKKRESDLLFQVELHRCQHLSTENVCGSQGVVCYLTNTVRAKLVMKNLLLATLKSS